MLRLDRGTQEATELHCALRFSVRAAGLSKASFTRRRKRRIKGGNQAEEGWADKTESWRKEEKTEE